MHWDNRSKILILLATTVVICAVNVTAMEVNTNTAGASVTVEIQKASSEDMLTNSSNKVAKAVVITENIALAVTASQYIQSIHQLESQAGAYAPSLGEKVQSLALIYYKQGKYQEAANIYKRALHINRINNGLYNIEQIPILNQMIKNHLAVENYKLADDDQYYLYRTRLRNYQPNNPEFVNALRDYALWQHEAYLLEIGKDLQRRLINMNKLQSQALEITQDAYGFTNSKNLPVLDELLNTQYLIASYNSTSESDSPNMKYDKLGFDFLRLSSYRKGVDILAQTIAIHDANPEATMFNKVDAVVALGDWHQWNKKRSQAFEAYTKAYHLLAGIEEGQDRLTKVFGNPQALPATGVFNSELSMRKGKKQGYIIAQFAVSNYGEAQTITFKEKQDDVDTKQYERHRRRIKRSLSNILFRPRFENAVPVYTKNVVHRFDFYY